jgi:type III secretory pathway component EscS
VTAFVVGYAVVGLGLGLYAATREYQDGSLPHDDTSAGVVGLFVACFWPVVVVIIAFGVAAHWLRTKIGDSQ